MTKDCLLFLRAIVIGILWCLCAFTAVACAGDKPPGAIRIATLNIRMFPCNHHCVCMQPYGFTHCRSPKRIRTDREALAALIRETAPDILAVQEVLKPDAFQGFISKALGESHVFRFADTPKGGPQKVGFAFNTDTVTCVECRQIEETITAIDRNKHGHCSKRVSFFRPAMACKFRVDGTDTDFIVVTVHLKSGKCSGVRKAQWKALGKAVRQLAKDDPDIIILGDFNDWKRSDRDCRQFLEESGYTLVSADLECSSLYRKRPSPIDHIIVSPSLANDVVSGSFKAGGPAGEGCEWNDDWKLYRERVSDHCPVMVDIRTQTGH